MGDGSRWKRSPETRHGRGLRDTHLAVSSCPRAPVHDRGYMYQLVSTIEGSSSTQGWISFNGTDLLRCTLSHSLVATNPATSRRISTQTSSPPSFEFSKDANNKVCGTYPSTLTLAEPCLACFCFNRFCSRTDGFVVTPRSSVMELLERYAQFRPVWYLGEALGVVRRMVCLSCLLFLHAVV